MGRIPEGEGAWRGGDDDSQLLSLKKKVSKSEPLSPSGPTDYPAMSSRDYS